MHHLSEYIIGLISKLLTVVLDANPLRLLIEEDLPLVEIAGQSIEFPLYLYEAGNVVDLVSDLGSMINMLALVAAFLILIGIVWSFVKSSYDDDSPIDREYLWGAVFILFFLLLYPTVIDLTMKIVAAIDDSIKPNKSMLDAMVDIQKAKNDIAESKGGIDLFNVNVISIMKDLVLALFAAFGEFAKFLMRNMQTWLTGLCIMFGPIILVLSLIKPIGPIWKSWFRFFFTVQLWTVTMSILDKMVLALFKSGDHIKLDEAGNVITASEGAMDVAQYIASDLFFYTLNQDYYVAVIPGAISAIGYLFVPSITGIFTDDKAAASLTQRMGNMVAATTIMAGKIAMKTGLTLTPGGPSKDASGAVGLNNAASLMAGGDSNSGTGSTNEPPIQNSYR